MVLKLPSPQKIVHAGFRLGCGKVGKPWLNDVDGGRITKTAPNRTASAADVIRIRERLFIVVPPILFLVRRRGKGFKFLKRIVEVYTLFGCRLARRKSRVDV